MSKITWNMKKVYYRCYQSVMRFALKFLKFPHQQVIKCAGGINKIPRILKERKLNHILFICSKSVRKNGLLNELIIGLEKEQIGYTLFENIHPNTTTQNVEEGYALYTDNNCEAIVAIGGGSVLDCAKIIGVKVTNPTLSFNQMKNMIAIKNSVPFLVTVPTTAGTGSESTVAAVVMDEKIKEKYAVISLHIMPHCAILDENLTMDLPKEFTAYTGMDALTHAVEAYIGTFGTAYTNSEALKAIKLIFENIETTFTNGDNQESRRNMLIASNHAANAFTRAYTGYVHTISHALSALYDVGHGKTNSIILPNMLKYYGKTIESKLAQIAVYTQIGHVGEKKEVLSQKVIERIEQLNKAFNIPDKVAELQKEDIDIIVKKALKEGNPAYPVPKIMSYGECFVFVKGLLP